MQKIVNHLWFDKEAEEAANFYASLFPNSSVSDKVFYPDAGKEVHGHDAGDLMSVNFELEGQKFSALNGGPDFKFTPAISFFIRCATESEVDELYSKLSTGGSVLMELGKYPFSDKYAWVNDKFGLSWQIFLGQADRQKITPTLMFTGLQNGKCEEAMNLYTSLFPDSRIGGIARYTADQAPNIEGTVIHASYFLNNQEYMAMDSNLEHRFNFNESISFIVNCKDQAEIDKYWNALSAVPESEQCGWLKDKFGVSWQIVPEELGEIFTKAGENADKVMTALLQMKKLDISVLSKAAEME